MSEDIHDLDKALAQHGCDAELATSAPLKALSSDLNAKAGRYLRKGLGYWRAFSLDIEGFGEMILAGPEHIEDAGTSIWYRRGGKLDDVSVASVICALSSDNAIQFLDPDTGDAVRPDLKALLRRDLMSWVHVRKDIDRNGAASIH
ncbi:MAG: hypothetical protein RIA08_17525 [Roseovarius sp.]|uniref:hypothetical protein n=1 Tax=Roseovarius sp. TaxID=1486281 RepID=UPI0032EDB72E